MIRGLTSLESGSGELSDRKLAPPVGELRFWLIMGLVAVFTVLHSAVELIEENGELTGVLEGIHHLPVPAYVIPVILAGFWYGYRGGVLTGVATMVLSIPNLILFHSDGFSWIGEAIGFILILAVGVAVAIAVERSNALRREAVANSRRLSTLWDVAGMFGRKGTGAELAATVTKRLAAMDTVRAVGFLATNGSFDEQLTVVGENSSLAKLQDAAAGGTVSGRDGVFVFDVATDRESYGQLFVAQDPGDVDPEDAVVFTLIAREMGAVMENLQHREQQRYVLQQYASEITKAQETERSRIARELHDGPTQAMVVLKRGLDSLSAEMPSASAAAHSADELRGLVQQTLQSLQRTMLALRPPALDDLGLVAALRSLVDRRTARGVIAVDLEVRGAERRLDPELELAAYRVAQEALTNVERHAGTDEASVVAEYLPESFTLTVSDAGTGFDPDARLGAESFGLMGMRERARLVAGSLRIESSPGGGTSIVFSKPERQSAAPPWIR